MRINNFYLNNIGKCTPVSFQSTKTQKRSRNIDKLVYEGNEINSQEEIIGIMTEHYQTATGSEFQQKMTLINFLNKYNISLPTISETDLSLLDNSITADEIQWALKNSSEIGRAHV